MCVNCGTCANPDCRNYDFWGNGDPCGECTDAGSRGEVSRRTAITQGAQMTKTGWFDCGVVALLSLGYTVLVAELVRDNWPL